MLKTRMSADTDSRKLSDLRVVDLKSELEKRGLDKSGNKQTLTERLQKALEDEGLDPETYEFVDENKSKLSSSQSTNQQENISTKEVEESEDAVKNCKILEEIDEIIEESDTSKNSKNEEKLHEKAKADDTEEKSKTIDNSKKWKTLDKHNASLKDDSGLAEAESPIRLTLEEEETFQDEEIESVNESIKSNIKINKQNENDAKNSSNKNQDAAKDTPVNSEKAQENKKQDGTGSAKTRLVSSWIRDRYMWFCKAFKTSLSLMVTHQKYAAKFKSFIWNSSSDILLGKKRIFIKIPDGYQKNAPLSHFKEIIKTKNRKALLKAVFNNFSLDQLIITIFIIFMNDYFRVQSALSIPL